MKKVAIFASGTGSNFEKIADDERLKDKISIELLVCDRKDAAVIRKAHDRNIKVFIFSAKDFESKEAYESVIFEKVKDLDYIFLAGYMRIISPYFLERYKKQFLIYIRLYYRNLKVKMLSNKPLMQVRKK